MRGGYLHKLFFHIRDLSTLLHLFIQLFICMKYLPAYHCVYVSVGTQGYLFNILGYNPSLLLLFKLLQLWPMVSLSDWLSSPFYMPFSFCYCCFLNTSLLSGTIRGSRLILHILCSSVSLRSPSSFNWRMVLEIMIWALNMLVAIEVCILAYKPTQWKELENICMHIKSCTHTYQNFYLSALY